ncbi:hypothetical protein KHA80_07265 [Anaerobacillus sp. HL2]|nr:hypothetical protein KHA80_07265 [Anaerobacillus sp. HL2]
MPSILFLILIKTNIQAVPLEMAINQLKRVDPNGELVQAAETVGINFGEIS